MTATYTCDAQGCAFHVAYAASDTPGEPIAHSCPYYGGSTHYGVRITVTIIDKKWRDLEQATCDLLAARADASRMDAVHYLQGRCQGMAEVIAEFMRPFYNDPETHEPDPKLILKETMVRIRHRKAGNTDYVSAGQESRRYEFPQQTKYEKKAPPAEKALTEEQIATCKTFYSNGFTTKQIAESLDVSISLVNKAVA